MKCIYKISNNTNDMIYIGSTKSFDLRKWYHLKDLKERLHCNYKLQRDYNSGIIFEFTVLEVIQYNKELLKREQHYINTLKPQYNILKIAATSQQYHQIKKSKKKRDKKLNAQAEMNVLLYH